MELRLIGLGGPLATLDADRTWGSAEVQEAMVNQCELPGWQYNLIDGTLRAWQWCELASLAVVGEDPETRIPMAEITIVRRSNLDSDRRVVQDAIAHWKTSVLQVALKHYFKVDAAINHKGAFLRKGQSIISSVLREVFGTCFRCWTSSV